MVHKSLVTSLKQIFTKISNKQVKYVSDSNVT